MLAMQKKKKPDRHKAPRKSLQIPAEWYAYAERLAAERPMPVTWFIIDMINKAAEAAGRTDAPALPWKPK